MGYTSRHLLANETILYEGRISKWYFIPTILLGIVAIGIMLVGWIGGKGDEPAPGNQVLIFAGAAFLLFSIVKLVVKLFVKFTSEFVITDKRCVLKRGFVSIRVMDMALDKCEGIGFSQGLWERIFKFGRITATTGGSTSTFEGIDKPFEFRNQLNVAMDDYKRR